MAVRPRLGTGRGAGGGEIERTVEVAHAHPSRAPIHVRLTNRGDESPRLRSRALRVTPEPDVLAELRSVLGRDRVRLVEVPAGR